MIPDFLKGVYRRRVKPLLLGAMFRRRGAQVHLDLHWEQIGLFAQLTACLQLFQLAERWGFVPFIALSSPNYLDPDGGDDWLSHYFVRNAVPRGARRVIRIGHGYELPGIADPTLQEAHDIFFRALTLRPEIAAEVDAFCRENLVGETLGVHYRGTDKVTEAVPPSYAEVHGIIDKVLLRRPGTTSLFVASDEQRFVDGIAARFPALRVSSFQDSVRSSDGRPVHQGARAPGNTRMGRDALVNALILSRCAAVVRSTSFLSAWASILNPGLEVVLTNMPHTGKLWYPERVIVHTATLARDLPG